MNIRKRALEGMKAAVVLAVFCGAALTGTAQEPAALQDNPAYLNIDAAFDFSEIQPAVNVHMPKFLLNNMLSQLNGGPEDPFAGTGINIDELTRDIRLIRFVVFEAKEPRKQKIAESGVDKLKKSMSSKWMPIVNVPDGNVTIFAMGDEAGNRLAGLAMIVAEKDSIVIGNIVGEVQIGKIIAAATKMAAASEGNPRAKEFLQKLMGGFQPAAASADSETAAPAAKENSEANSPD